MIKINKKTLVIDNRKFEFKIEVQNREMVSKNTTIE